MIQMLMNFGLMIASNYSTHFFCWCLRFIKKNHKIFLVTAGSFFFKCLGITPFFFYREVALEFFKEHFGGSSWTP